MNVKVSHHTDHLTVLFKFYWEWQCRNNQSIASLAHCVGNLQVIGWFQAQKASNAENFRMAIQNKGPALQLCPPSKQGECVCTVCTIVFAVMKNWLIFTGIHQSNFSGSCMNTPVSVAHIEESGSICCINKPWINNMRVSEIVVSWKN